MPIKVISLGKSGVYVDQNVLSTDVPNDALLLAQNAEHDPTSGHMGALRKRAGWARFNAVNAGGAILGGIPMPVAGTGGAPASGGGATIGTSGPNVPSGTKPPGTGDGTGKPGGTTDNGPRKVPTPGAGAFNPPFSGKRMIAIARNGNDGVANAGGAGWYLTSKSIADSATSTLTPGPPVAPYSFPPASPFLELFGTPGVQWNDYESNTRDSDGAPVTESGDNRLYYAGTAGDQSVSHNMPIRVTDGGSDGLLCTIPATIPPSVGADPPGRIAAANGTQRPAIASMHIGGDGFLYVGVKDKWTGQNDAGSVGRFFRVTQTSGAAVNLGAAATSGFADTVNGVVTYIPYVVTNFNGNVFTGGLSDNAVNATCTVDAFSVDGRAFTTDRAFTAAEASMISCCVLWKGALIVGVGCNQNTSGSGDGSFLAKPFIRFAGALGTAANWQALSFDTSRSGKDTFGNIITSMVTFNGDLYVAWYAPGIGGAIYKAVQGTSDTILTAANLSLTWTNQQSTGNFHYTLYVDDGVLYAVGTRVAAASYRVYTSLDGTTWTDQSSNVPDSGHTSTPRPILCGFDA